MAVNIIKSISYAEVRDVIKYMDADIDSVDVQVVEWKPIPIHPASADYSCAPKRDNSGVYYTTSINARLKKDIPFDMHCVLKLELCSGVTYIIGTVDVPVIPSIDMNLNISRISISIDAPNPPKLLQFS